jgi:hypothetical protein
MRDSDLRQALHARLRLEHGAAQDTLVVDEFDLGGSARADVAVINGALAGYEIKSDHDTLRRLGNQIQEYARVFDEVTLVVTVRHLERAHALVPEWWSIISAEDEADQIVLIHHRDGYRNEDVDPIRVGWLLWRSELVEELAQRARVVGIRSKPRSALVERLATSVPLDEMRSVVRDRLRARRRWRVARSPAANGVQSRVDATSPG